MDVSVPGVAVTPAAIVVLGSANMDLVVRQPRLPRIGETMFGSDFRMVPGGKGLNQAVAAARVGGDVAFLGAVGRDSLGDELRRCLENEGIGVDGLQQVDGETGTAHVAVLDGGDNSIVVVSGANAAITTLDDDARARIRAARFLMAQFERPLALVGEALHVARDAGVSTVLTPAPVRAADDDLLALVDILIPNAGEACQLADTADEAEAARKLSRTVGLVVMTRGERGAVIARRGELIAEVPARKVAAVDTTAAGDTFAGVLVARLAAGAELAAALDAATVAASISVTRAGASTSMPTWSEIDASL